MMIAKLRGTLDSTGSNWAILDVNGVFYHVFCSAKTLADLLEIGATYTLLTEMQVREDLMALYGFSTPEEQEWFRVLTSVQGVGMKVGLAILSVATPRELHKAVLSQDKTTFAGADGVGPKLASRLVNELKDKVEKVFGTQSALAQHSSESGAVISLSNHTAKPDDSFEEAASALINLGYRAFEANQAVAFLKQEGHTGTVEEIIPLALARLTRKAR